MYIYIYLICIFIDIYGAAVRAACTLIRQWCIQHVSRTHLPQIAKVCTIGEAVLHVDFQRAGPRFLRSWSSPHSNQWAWSIAACKDNGWERSTVSFGQITAACLEAAQASMTWSALVRKAYNIHTYMYTRLYKWLGTYVYIYIHIFIFIYRKTHIYYIYIYTHIHIHIQKNTYIYIYIVHGHYIYTFTVLYTRDSIYCTYNMAFESIFDSESGWLFHLYIYSRFFFVMWDHVRSSWNDPNQRLTFPARTTMMVASWAPKRPNWTWWVAR